MGAFGSWISIMSCWLDAYLVGWTGWDTVLSGIEQRVAEWIERCLTGVVVCCCALISLSFHVTWLVDLSATSLTTQRLEPRTHYIFSSRMLRDIPARSMNA